MALQALKQLCSDELLARRDDEGCLERDLTEIRALYENIKDDASESELEELYRQMLDLCPRERQPWEPSALQAIRENRPSGPRCFSVRLAESVLKDKVYGGWLGRVAGCALGKPVEGWQRHDIEAYLRAYGESDITDFIPYDKEIAQSLSANMSAERIRACRGNIQYMVRDDDMDYTIIALDVLSNHGFEFATIDIAEAWLRKLPYMCTYTAERVAYRNLVEQRTPPFTAYYRNPYRQWIGAQIRADAFGYVCPGRPQLAAELAWRDASLSHVKNGIYGEMWVAAAIATAFVTDDINQIIDTATSEIPTESRFAQMVQDVRAWHQQHPDWKRCWDAIRDKYGHLHRVHTINNAALVLLGLLYGGNDLGKAIGIAVQGGWDTDCNGATVGSIVGVIMGAKGLPRRWVEPFNDTLETAVFGYNYPKISELADATLAIAVNSGY